MLTFVKATPPRVEYSKEAFEQQLLLAVVSANLPLAFVEDLEVVKLIKLLRPDATPPGRKRIRELLAQKYDEIQQGLLPGLGEKTKVSIAVDCWTSPYGQALLSVLCYYVAEDWQYKEVLIGFESVSGSHTGQNLAAVVKQVLQHQNLTHRLLAVTSDNASNNNTMAKSLASWHSSQQLPWNPSAMRIRGLVHILQLSAKALLSDLNLNKDGSAMSKELCDDDDEMDGGTEVSDEADEEEDMSTSGVGEISDAVNKVSYK